MAHQNSGPPLGRALVVVLSGVVFCIVLQGLESFFFLRDDNSTQHLPAYVHSYRSLVDDGTLALVNPHQYLGIPHLATGQPAVLYPPTYLAVAAASAVGDLRWTIDLLVAFHFAASALGMFVLLRHLGLGRRPGLPGGDVAGSWLWLTAPFVVIVSRAWIPYIYSAALLPWGLWLLLRVMERPGWRRGLAYGSFKTLYFFFGYPQTFVYSSLLEGGVWLCSRGSALARRGAGSLRETGAQAKSLVVAALWTLATSAPLLLPMLEAQSVSFMRRERLPLEVFAQYPMAVRDFLAAQIFVFRDEVFVTSASSIYFVGLPVVAALVAFFVLVRRDAGRRSPRTDGRIAVLATLGLVAWIASTSAWRLAHGVPLLSSFRWPAKFFLFFYFASVPAVCVVYERLADRSRRWALAGLAVTLVGSLAVIAVPEWRRSMGDATLERPVAEIRQQVLAACGEGAESGRIVAFRKDATLSAERWDEVAPNLAAYNYATLLDLHHLGGYEPLVSETHFDLSTGMNYTATLSLDQVAPALFAHLARWGVRCVLVPELPGVDEAFSGIAGLRRLGREHGIVSYRLDAAPVVGWVDSRQPVAFRWTSSGLVAQLDGRGGILRLAVAPLGQWTVEVDGVLADSEVDRRAGLLVSVPAGARELRLGYREPSFELGLWVASLALAALALGRVLSTVMPQCGD